MINEINQSTNNSVSVSQKKSAIVIVTTLFFSINEKAFLFDDGGVCIDDTIEAVNARFNNPPMWSSKRLGEDFRDQLIGNPYYIFDILYDDAEDLINQGKEKYSIVQDHFSLFWFIKDHSASAGRYACYSDEGQIAFVVSVQDVHYNSTGELKTTTFSYDDFIRLGELSRAISALGVNQRVISEKVVQYPNGGQLIVSFLEHKDDHIINRAIKFLLIARRESQLAARIAYYVLVLECLFSADQGDGISHKISERIAVYLSSNAKKRVEIYYNVKSLYNIRSKYIHGQKVYNLKGKGGLGKMRDDAVIADNYVREVLLKIVIDDHKTFLMDDDLLGRWFIEMALTHGLPKEEDGPLLED